MKAQIKKYLCLTLSAVLLFTNGQVFAKDLLVKEFASDIISQSEIDELQKLADNVRIKYKFSEKHITSNVSYINFTDKNGLILSPYTREKIVSNSLDKYYKDLQEFQVQLSEFQTKMRATYQKYLDALPEGTYLKNATTKYINGRMDQLFSEQNYVLDKLLSTADVMQEEKIVNMSDLLHPTHYLNEERRAQHLLEIYKKDSRLRNLFLEDLAERQTYYDKLFTWDLEKLLDQLTAARTSFNAETVQFFSKQSHTAEELLEYFTKYGPEEQKATLFALRTTDEGLTRTHLIPYLRYYLKHTNRRIWKLEKYSAENLARNIAHMTFAQKTEYIDDLLDFSPEVKAFRQEVRQAEKVAGKKIVNRSSIKLGGTFIAVGAALIAFTITKFAAENDFKQSNIAQTVGIRNKMDAGELIPLDEFVNYFASERNEAELAQNPSLMAEVFETARTVNALLDSSEVDLSASDAEIQESETRGVSNSISTGINNFNPNKISSKIGTLKI